MNIVIWKLHKIMIMLYISHDDSVFQLDHSKSECFCITIWGSNYDKYVEQILSIIAGHLGMLCNINAINLQIISDSLTVGMLFETSSLFQYPAGI